MFSLYYKRFQIDNLSLGLPVLRLDGVELKIKAGTKFLGVLPDEIFTWKDYKSTIQFEKNHRSTFQLTEYIFIAFLRRI